MTNQATTIGTMYGIAAVLTTNTTFIGNIVSIDTAPGGKRTSVESTHSGSTGGHKTYVPGDITDNGMLVVTCQYNTQLDYKTLFAAGCDTVTITFPKRATTCGGSLAGTAATWSASVVFEEYSPKWEFDSLAVITLTFRVSGAPTYVAAQT